MIALCCVSHAEQSMCTFALAVWFVCVVVVRACDFRAAHVYAHVNCESEHLASSTGGELEGHVTRFDASSYIYISLRMTRVCFRDVLRVFFCGI